MFKIPEHGYCFVCGNSSKKGLNATLFLMDDRSVCCEYEFDINFQGPPYIKELKQLVELKKFKKIRKFS
jgi:hypothetical protein